MRPPPRSPPARDRNTIDLGDLRGLDGVPPGATHDGGYDPRLEAHRWLRGVLGAESRGDADGLGIEVAVAVHQETASGRQHRQAR